MKFEFKGKIPEQRRKQLEDILCEHELRIHSYKVIINRGVGELNVKESDEVLEEYYVCQFMNAKTEMGVDLVAILSETEHRVYVKRRRQTA